MESPKKKISEISATILKILQDHPNGLDIGEIRRIGGISGQQHLDKRLREIYPFYEISRERVGRRTIYRYIGELEIGSYDYSNISKKLRAEILHRDGRRCRMCGKTVDQDPIKLHIDHKIPREWGGLTSIENLWSLCSACNEGKRNYFSSFNPDLMKTVLGHESVHRRIAEILHMRIGQWIDCDLIEFVSNFDDYQTDWPKRLRELRYFNFDIETTNKKVGRRTLSYYRLNNWPANQPTDLSAAARQFEKDRAAANRRKAPPPID